jgi:hypothetical protein
MRALRRYLLLLAAVTPVALWAAELPSAPGQTGSPGPASTTTGATAANPTADGAAPVSPETGAEADQTPGTMTANDTFVPTVEISEDLSVSFPADI